MGRSAFTRSDTGRCRGVIIPPLPEKNAVQKFTMGTDFIEDRRRALQVRSARHASACPRLARRPARRLAHSHLPCGACERAPRRPPRVASPQVFINRVAAHPALKGSSKLQRFLEANEDEFALEVARSQAVSGRTGPALRRSTPLCCALVAAPAWRQKGVPRLDCPAPNMLSCAGGGRRGQEAAGHGGRLVQGPRRRDAEPRRGARYNRCGRGPRVYQSDKGVAPQGLGLVHELCAIACSQVL